MTLDFSSKVQNLALIFGIDLAQPHMQARDLERMTYLSRSVSASAGVYNIEHV